MNEQTLIRHENTQMHSDVTHELTKITSFHSMEISRLIMNVSQGLPTNYATKCSMELMFPV